MSDQSAAVCPVCGARRALLQRYCNSCEEVATDCVYLALSIRRFVRRAEVAELCARIASSHYAAVDSASSHHALVRRDPERARLCVARLDRAYAEHHTALSRLAELALEDR